VNLRLDHYKISIRELAPNPPFVNRIDFGGSCPCDETRKGLLFSEGRALTVKTLLYPMNCQPMSDFS